MVTQITADELAHRIDAGESMSVIDTRPAESFGAWHLPGAVNVPYDPREELDDDQLDRVRDAFDGRPVLAVCGKGLTSAPFAFDLEQHGYENVTVVKGGMEDWSTVYETVPIDAASDDLVVRQLQRRGKGCLGYVVGSKASGEAAVIDATRQIERYELAAEEAGLTIGRVFDTHVHADHISGGRRLADVLDVPYHLGERAVERDVDFAYEPLGDGTVVEVGETEIAAIHAPGHTTEMVNYLVDGEVLLTGDTLFVESVGRTELQFGEDDADEGAELLYETLHEKLLSLSDGVRVLPGHVSVSSDGRYEHGTPGDPVQASLQDLRETLDLLQLDETAFVRRLVENAPQKPPNYERVIAINTGKDAPESEAEATELELGPNNCAA